MGFNFLMQAMVLHAPCRPLEAAEIAVPKPGPGQVLLQVRACAVCRTDLHIVSRLLPNKKLPLIPGHEIVGVVAAGGPGAERFQIGDRGGVPWLGWICGEFDYCRSGREKLYGQARFSAYSKDGGF